MDKNSPNYATIIEIKTSRELSPEVSGRFAEATVHICRNNELPAPVEIIETPYNRCTVINYDYPSGCGEIPVDTTSDRTFISIATRKLSPSAVVAPFMTPCPPTRPLTISMAAKMLGVGIKTIKVTTEELNEENCSIAGYPYNLTRLPTHKYH